MNKTNEYNVEIGYNSSKSYRVLAIDDEHAFMKAAEEFNKEFGADYVIDCYDTEIIESAT